MFVVVFVHMLDCCVFWVTGTDFVPLVTVDLFLSELFMPVKQKEKFPLKNYYTLLKNNFDALGYQYFFEFSNEKICALQFYLQLSLYLLKQKTDNSNRNFKVLSTILNNYS